jgi:hypothetical protein
MQICNHLEPFCAKFMDQRPKEFLHLRCQMFCPRHLSRRLKRGRQSAVGSDRTEDQADQRPADHPKDNNGDSQDQQMLHGRSQQLRPLSLETQSQFAETLRSSMGFEKSSISSCCHDDLDPKRLLIVKNFVAKKSAAAYKKPVGGSSPEKVPPLLLHPADFFARTFSQI